MNWQACPRLDLRLGRRVLCPSAHRIGVLLTVELRTQWRQRIPLAVVGLAAFWSVLLILLPAPTASAVTPYLVILDIATIGTLFVGAQIVTDRSTGAMAALGVSPLRSWEYLVIKVAPLGLLTATGTVPILLAGRNRDRLGIELLTAILVGLLLLTIATEVASRKGELVRFMLALAAPLTALFAIPIAASIGLLSGLLWYAVPTTGALAILRGTEPHPASWLVGYLAVTVAAATVYAAGSLRRRPVVVSARPARLARSLPTRPRWMVFPRADLRNVTRDSMVAVVALSPLLLALLLRFGYPPLAGWLHARGVDLVPYAPVLVILAVMVHLPVSFGMAGALLVLDDLEDNVLTVVRTSPMGMRRFLAYRLWLVTALSATGLAVAAPLCGLVPRSYLPALPLAALLGPLMMLAMLAVARSRVQGVTAGKVLALPMYVPIAGWWLTSLDGWPLAPFPTYWIARFWVDDNLVGLAAGLLCVAVWLVPLTRRVLHSLEVA